MPKKVKSKIKDRFTVAYLAKSVYIQTMFFIILYYKNFNNPMVGATVAVAASVEETAKNIYFHKNSQTFQSTPVDQSDCIFYIICKLFFNICQEYTQK